MQCLEMASMHQSKEDYVKPILFPSLVSDLAYTWRRNSKCDVF